MLVKLNQNSLIISATCDTSSRSDLVAEYTITTPNLEEDPLVTVSRRDATDLLMKDDILVQELRDRYREGLDRPHCEREEDRHISDNLWEVAREFGYKIEVRI